MSRTRTAIAAAVLVLLLGGCAAGTPDDAEHHVEKASSDWPRTITVPGATGHESTMLELAAPPERIAALDYESTETIAELGLAEHLVLIPEAVLNPALGSHLDELQGIEGTFPVAMEVDAETVISSAADLVVTSPRHGNEAPIVDVLERAGIPVLELPRSWDTSDSLLENIRLIGEATGAETAADALAARIGDGLATASAKTKIEEGNPGVVVLTNQAGRPFVTAGEAFPVELIERAGARNLAAELGIERTGPLTAEQLITLDPDGILLIDMNGSGDRMFAELLGNPAVAALPAVADQRLLTIAGKQVQALGLAGTVDGLHELTEWVATL